MQTQWILSSTSLPRAGKPIYFLLADRNVPMHGTFANGIFHAHWADYPVDRVESWYAEDELRAASIEAPRATIAGRFFRTLKRWSNASEDAVLVHSPRKDRA